MKTEMKTECTIEMKTEMKTPWQNIGFTSFGVISGQMAFGHFPSVQFPALARQLS